MFERSELTHFCFLLESQRKAIWLGFFRSTRLPPLCTSPFEKKEKKQRYNLKYRVLNSRYLHGWIGQRSVASRTHSPTDKTLSPVDLQLKRAFGKRVSLSPSQAPGPHRICDYRQRRFIIGWAWQEGREFCQTLYKTNYFAINSLRKQVDIMIIAYENNIKGMAWIGLSDDMQDGDRMDMGRWFPNR